MGVDGIGSGGGRPIRDVGAGEAASSNGVVDTTIRAAGDAPAASAAGGVQSSAELGRLERGEIDLDHYLDARVDDAVRHLEGRLSGEQVDFVRQSLREQLATDPVLTDLVRRTTGAVSTPIE